MKIISDIGLRLALKRLDKLWHHSNPEAKHYKKRHELIMAIEEYENRTLPPPWGNNIKVIENEDHDVLKELAKGE